MNIRLCQNTSPSIMLSKTLTEGTTYSGQTRHESSIVDPVIEFEATNLSEDMYNYMYIPQFNRYYFIYELITVQANVWQVTGHVDVLMSFASDILASTQLIGRQEKKRNNYLVDTKLPITTKRNFICKRFGTRLTEGDYFVLCVTGGVQNNA